MLWRVWWFSLLGFVVGCDAISWFGLGADAQHGSASSRGQSRGAALLIVGRAADADSLDPAVAGAGEALDVTAQIFDRLLYYEPGRGQLQPGLAVSWEVSAAGRVWTLALRRNVGFHDGTRFDADAVVFSFERQRDAENNMHRAGFGVRTPLQSIDTVAKVDDFTVRISLKEQYASFLATMAMSSVAIVSPAAVAQWELDFGAHPVGTGPFRLVSWRRGDRIVLERNDDYWAKKPAFAQLRFQVIADRRQRLVALESGAIDIAHSIAPEEVQLMSLHPALKLYQTTTNNVTYLAFNTGRAPFDRLAVRQAISYAIHKNPIVKVLWQGTAVAANGPLSPDQWGYSEILKPYVYDPVRAQALLDAAITARERNRTYKLHVTSTPRPYLPNPERLARALQANLADVGIETEIVVKPYHTHAHSLAQGEHDLAIHALSTASADPDSSLYSLFYIPEDAGTTSKTSFTNDEVNTLLAHARGIDDPNERALIYARVQNLVHRHAPWVPLAHARLLVAARADIRGVIVNPAGYVEYRDAWRVDREQRRFRSVVEADEDRP